MVISMLLLNETSSIIQRVLLARAAAIHMRRLSPQFRNDEMRLGTLLHHAIARITLLYPHVRMNMDVTRSERRPVLIK